MGVWVIEQQQIAKDENQGNHCALSPEQKVGIQPNEEPISESEPAITLEALKEAFSDQQLNYKVVIPSKSKDKTPRIVLLNQLELTPVLDALDKIEGTNAAVEEIKKTVSQIEELFENGGIVTTSGILESASQTVANRQMSKTDTNAVIYLSAKSIGLGNDRFVFKVLPGVSILVKSFEPNRGEGYRGRSKGPTLQYQITDTNGKLQDDPGKFIEYLKRTVGMMLENQRVDIPHLSKVTLAELVVNQAIQNRMKLNPDQSTNSDLEM